MTTNPFSTTAQRPRSPADGQKFDLETARRLVGQFADMIRPVCARLVVAGSIRRGTPYVKDAELVAIPTPDLFPTLDQLVAQARLLNDAPAAARTLIQRDLPPGGLLSPEAFRAARDAFAAQGMEARLPALQTQAAALWARYQAARREIEQAGERTKKELENRLYAEDGLAWAWANVDAEISSIRRAMGS